MLPYDLGQSERPLPERLQLDGKHIAVTGAASGLGLAMSRGFIECGARVTLIDCDHAGVVAAADALGPSADWGIADIADPEAIEHSVASCAADHDGLDAMFANAGIAGGPAIESLDGRLNGLDWPTFDHALAVNLRGAIATIKAAAMVMGPVGHGSIVVTVSTAGLRADSMVGYGYAASKGALANVVRQAAVDLAPDGIRVNGIAPGPFFTNIGGGGAIPSEIEEAWADTVLLRRMAHGSEIQGLAALLASDASSFMTGTIYPVDGGALAGAF